MNMPHIYAPDIKDEIAGASIGGTMYFILQFGGGLFADTGDMSVTHVSLVLAAIAGGIGAILGAFYKATLNALKEYRKIYEGSTAFELADCKRKYEELSGVVESFKGIQKAQAELSEARQVEIINLRQEKKELKNQLEELDSEYRRMSSRVLNNNEKMSQLMYDATPREVKVVNTSEEPVPIEAQKTDSKSVVK